MALPFSLFLALRYMRPKRSFVSLVTVISVLGVVLGVAILIIVLAVMTGFDNMWREKILSFKPHLTVSSNDGRVMDEDAETLCRRLEKIPGVTGAAAVIHALSLMRHEGRVSAPMIIGVSPNRADRVSRIAESLAAGEFRFNEGEIVIGRDLAYALAMRPGDACLVYSSQNVTREDEMHLPEELTVSGIFDMGMKEYDSRFVLTSLDVARDLTGIEEGAEKIYVMTEDPFLFPVMKERITDELGGDFRVTTWRDEDSLLFQALANEKGMMFALLSIITIVAAFCIAITLIVLTVYKTGEIGLLKALGFSPGRIMGVFVWHGWIQGALGTILGIVLGLVFVENLNEIVGWLTRFNVEVFPKDIYGLDGLPAKVDARDVERIAIGVMVLSTLASILASCRAVSLDPVEALRE
jgi:lipoprotein-releasing system permease protein